MYVVATVEILGSTVVAPGSCVAVAAAGTKAMAVVGVAVTIAIGNLNDKYVGLLGTMRLRVLIDTPGILRLI